MIEYIKMIIVAILSGATAPLPVSSAAHFNFLSNVIGISGESDRMALYYSGFMIAFAIVLFISFRKIYIGSFKSAFVSKKNEKKYEKSKGYRYIFKNIMVSVIPTFVLFVPVSKEKLLIDFFDSFMNINSVILSGFACIITACILVIALWYTGRKRDNDGETANIKTALRMSFYQLPCYIIPGFSHVAAGSANLLICDVKKKTFLSELYVYLAPSMFIVGLVKLIRCVAGGVLFDPMVLVIGMIFFAASAKLIVSLTMKFNIRRLFGFFAAYSFVFGVFIAVASFYI